jgi:hypothetical protein
LAGGVPRIGHEATGRHEFRQSINRGDAIRRCSLDDDLGIAPKKIIGRDDEAAILSYRGRQNESKRAENGTKSASMKIEQTIDKAKISAQSRSRRFSVAPMMDGGDV